MKQPILRAIGLSVIYSCVLGSTFVVTSCGGLAVDSRPISGRSEADLDKLKRPWGELRVPAGKGDRMDWLMADFKTAGPRQTVSLPMASAYGLPAAEVSVNGTGPEPFLVDTGAQVGMTSASLAIRTKARVYEAPAGSPLPPAVGFGGTEATWLARFDRLDYGGLTVEEGVFLLRRHETSIRFLGSRLAEVEMNILGMPALKPYSYVTFDYPAARFVFSAKDRFSPDQRMTRLPMTLCDCHGLPHVPVMVGRKTYLARIDTGGRFELKLSDRLARELGWAQQVQNAKAVEGHGIGGRVQEARFGIPVPIHLGNLKLDDVTALTGGADSETLIIGSKLLERWKVTFDFKRSALWLDDPGHLPAR